MLKMLFTVFAISLCYAHVYGASVSEWSEATELIRILNAKKTNGRGTLPQDSDYEYHPLLMGGKQIALEEEKYGKLQKFIQNVGIDHAVRIFGNILVNVVIIGNYSYSNSTIQGAMTGEPQQYKFYDMRKPPCVRTMIERRPHEYRGDESNEVTIWMINEMSKNELSVEYKVDTERSQSGTTGKTQSYDTSVGATVGAGAFGVSASLSAKAGQSSQSGQSNTATNTNGTSETYEFTVQAQHALKLMRFVKMNKVTTRYEMTCYLTGFIGVQLGKIENGRWFLPVTELAKIYTDFVVDDSQSNTVSFKYTSTEVTNGLQFIQKNLGFKTSDLDQDFLRM